MPDKSRTFVFFQPCINVATVEIAGEEAQLSYALRSYYGETRLVGKYKGHSQLVTIKAYGFLLTRTLEFMNPLSAIAANRLQAQGYKVSGVLQVATLDKDYGFISAQNYEVNHLLHKVANYEQLADMDAVHLLIRKEISSWGDVVIDVEGRLVHDSEFGVVKRDPFAKAARLALKKQLSLLRRLNPLNTTTENPSQDGGVDL